MENKLSIPGAIIVAGVLIAGAVLIGTRGPSAPINTTTPQPTTQTQAQAVTADIKNVKTAGEPSYGDPKAPVTIAYWFDYQCPFCKQFEETVMSQLITEYVKAGKVKIVYKDFQFLGEDSDTAGIAARAVWEVAPDKFYEWHKAMFDKQDNENGGWGNKADILALTKSVGIDATKVESLMTLKASEYKKAMDADKAEGASFGVNGTPSFIVGKQISVGAQSYASVKQLVELALQGK